MQPFGVAMKGHSVAFMVAPSMTRSIFMAVFTVPSPTVGASAGAPAGARAFDAAAAFPPAGVNAAACARGAYGEVGGSPALSAFASVRSARPCEGARRPRFRPSCCSLPEGAA